MHIAPGTVIGGKYTLERKIATGGQGSVWVARHTQLQSTVAIKLMDAALTTSAMARTRFEREARATAQIRHRNIVHVQDCGIEGDVPYLVMELFQGEDLGKRLRPHKRISLQEAAVILNQVARGLRRMHEASFVHRDLKPGNIFLAKNDDGEEIVKILDFGIVKEADSLVGENTKTGEFMGSPHYMSPEQIQNVKKIDARGDLWSLGVVMYRAVTGELPFPGDAIGAVIAQILNGAVRPPSTLVPDLSTEVDAFFLRALARNPDQRFQSAGEMAEAFARLAGARSSTPPLHLSESGPLGGSPPVSRIPPPPPAQPPARESQMGAPQAHPREAYPRGSEPNLAGPPANPFSASSSRYPHAAQPAPSALPTQSAPSALPTQAAPYTRHASDPMLDGAGPPSSSFPRDDTDSPSSGSMSLARLTSSQPLTPQRLQSNVQRMRTMKLPKENSHLLPAGSQDGGAGAGGGVWAAYDAQKARSSTDPGRGAPLSNPNRPPGSAPEYAGPGSARGPSLGGDTGTSMQRDSSRRARMRLIVGGVLAGTGVGVLIAILVLIFRSR